MAIDPSLLEKTALYMTEFLNREIPEAVYFHNLKHTQEVVEAISEIGMHEGLSADELEPLIISAWFHDAGYCCKYFGHEDESIKIARIFLDDHDYPSEKISIVFSCIEATRYPQHPLNRNAKILCDADLYHFSCEDYDRHEQSLRKEWAIYLSKQYTDEEWVQENCYLLSTHHYFTPYGREVLQVKKEQNILNMQCRYEDK